MVPRAALGIVVPELGKRPKPGGKFPSWKRFLPIGRSQMRGSRGRVTWGGQAEMVLGGAAAMQYQGRDTWVTRWPSKEGTSPPCGWSQFKELGHWGPWRSGFTWSKRVVANGREGDGRGCQEGRLVLKQLEACQLGFAARTLSKELKYFVCLFYFCI